MHYDYVSQVTPTLKQYVVNTESCNIVTVSVMKKSIHFANAYKSNGTVLIPYGT